MIPLRIAILWHQHQPYYKKDGEFILPWVRLHGVKDYFDLPEILHEFPSVRQTFNLVPSLMMQIDEYISGKTSDKIQRLTLKRPRDLVDEEKLEILNLFFLCNAETMIFKYPRYKELFELTRDPDNALRNLSNQDWLDLQVWYNLTWLGEYSRKYPKAARLFSKEKNFSEDEKAILINYHFDILSRIKGQMNDLRSLGQIEISISPMYHPILPLLCNSRSALESMPGLEMPNPEFNYPDDAVIQVEHAIGYYYKLFDALPNGMWPSEGSISDEAIEIISRAGIKWIASDEEILFKTLGKKIQPTEKFFPRKIITDSGSLALILRDHFLSDNIGFVYSKWQAWDAANDFCHHLNSIRNEIINKHGEESLKYAVVPVILDGENCWEYYKDNGIHFLRDLFRHLSTQGQFETVTFSEAISNGAADYLAPINHIRAGSWINANFSIWIGHADDRAAWSLLGKARKTLENLRSQVPPETWNAAYDELLIAEGSDWFWWYGDEHMAENKDQFDILFRWHIEQMYRILGIDVPEEVFNPISEFDYKPAVRYQQGPVHPQIDGKLTDEDKWDNAGYYDAKSSGSTMHQVGELITRLWFATDQETCFFRCDTVHEIRKNERIIIEFHEPVQFRVVIAECGFRLETDLNLQFKRVLFASDEIIEFGLSKGVIFGHNSGGEAEISIHTISLEGEIYYPIQGRLKIRLD